MCLCRLSQQIHKTIRTNKGVLKGHRKQGQYINFFYIPVMNKWNLKKIWGLHPWHVVVPGPGIESVLW